MFGLFGRGMGFSEPGETPAYPRPMLPLACARICIASICIFTDIYICIYNIHVCERVLPSRCSVGPAHIPHEGSPWQAKKGHP